MTDLTQKVKYTVDVDLTQLANLKKELDNAEEAAKKLGASLDKLAGANVKGLRQLGGTVQALGTRLEKFATAVDPSSAAVTRLQAALGMIPPTATKAKAAIKETGDAIQKVGDTTVIAQQKTHDWRLSLLKYYGTFQVFSNAARQVWQGIREGAQQIDLDNTLTKQFANFRAEIERAQVATAGMVGRGQLTKSFALMSSFGIPMDQFAENMELVQKMAIRTGQSADFLTDSFARGVSRLSPLILDNLGIQVSLADANEAYSRATGKSVESMTKQERTGALLNTVLRQLKENTEGITLAADSAAGAVSRMETAWDDFWMGIKKIGGSAILEIDRSLSGAAADAVYFASKVEQLGGGLQDGGESLTAFAKLMASQGNDVADMLERWDELGGRTVGTGILDFLTGWMGGGLLGGASADSGPVEKMSQVIKDLQDVEWMLAGLHAGKGRKGLYSSDEIMGMVDAFGFMKNAQIEAALPAIAFKQLQADTNELVEEYIRSQGRKLHASDEEAVRLKAKELAEKRLVDTLQQAVKLSKEQGVPLAETLIILLHQGVALNGIDKTLDGIVEKNEKLREQNQKTEASWRFFENQTNARLAAQERLNKLHAGQLPIDLEIEEAQARVTAARKRLEETNKKIAEDRLTDELRIARMAQTEDIRRALAIEDEARLRKAAVDDWLLAYRGATNAQIEMDAKRLDAFSEALKTIAVAAGSITSEIYRANMMLAKGLEDAAKKLRGLKSTTSGPGGGGGAPKPEKPDQGWGWDYEAVFARQEAEAKALERFKEQAARLKEMRSELRRALVEDPSGRQAADALAEIRRMFGEMSEEHGAAWTTNMLTKMFGENGIREIFTASDAVDKLSDSFDRLINLSDGLRSVSEVMGEFRKGMSSIHGDLFGGEFISMIDDVGSAFDNLAEIQRKNAEATDKSHNAYNNVLGGIGAMRAFTQNLIKDRKDQAKVEALMQAAAAWAAWAIPDPVKAMGHTVAATMYAAVGFGAIKLPSGKAKSTTPRESRGGGGGDMKRPDIHIHIAGNVVQTEAERGVMAQAAIQEARRRGML